MKPDKALSMIGLAARRREESSAESLPYEKEVKSGKSISGDCIAEDASENTREKISEYV